MVELIKEILQNGELSAWVCSEEIVSLIKKDADTLMGAIEKAGMLPPLRLCTYMDDFWDETICAEMDGMSVKVAVWEKEDEEDLYE
jgi:hypothetical protein